MKKFFMFSIIITMLMIFTLLSYAVTFSDVPNEAWYHDYVYNLAEKNVINGYPDGTFKPDEKVSVGAFLKLIITASAPDVNYKVVKPDYDHWAAQYLKVAENCGVIEKGTYTQADLDREITRIELVRILTACDIKLVKTSQTGSTKVFTDTADLSTTDKIYLGHAVGIGVINGDPAGTFRPNDGLLRSECAKVIFTYTNR